MVNVDLYSAIITKVSNALDTLVSGEKPGFQTLSEGLIVLLCAEVVRQRVPDHGAVHSECSTYRYLQQLRTRKTGIQLVQSQILRLKKAGILGTYISTFHCILEFAMPS